MLIAYFDGASRGNPGPAGIGCVIINVETEEIVWELSKSIGERTNNEAEYMALIELLRYLVEKKIRNVHIHGDSQLVVNQVNGLWRVREPKLWPLCVNAQELMIESYVASLEWVPREKNRYADQLSSRALEHALEQKKNQAQTVFDPGKLEHLLGAIYVAHGTKDYAVDLENGVCTCPAFQRNKDCKHLRALKGVVNENVLVQNL